MGYLMPVYTVAILILFVYTAMRLVFKKKPGYEEEYYNNLIQQQQQQQQQHLQAQGSAVQDVSEPAQVVPETGEKTEIVNEERNNNQQLDTTAVKEQSSVLEPKKVEGKKEDK